MTRKVYAANSSRFYDTRPIKVYTDYEMANGTFLNLAVTDYTYENSAEVERITATTYAAGVNHQQVTIDETNGEAAAYSYAIGKPKFSQAVNGVQTWHDYEATTEHGATHKHSVTTKANGDLVAAQSRKTESFIAEDDTTIFTQESIWDGTQWLVLNTTAYEYDDEQRVTKTTRGNGRFSTTEWMCCGKLRETDEDGITTTYAYDSAHQLVETSRDAVYDGDVCVTPETITEYTRDAAGRVLNTTSRIGAMETTESSEYDLLGRTVKQTDVLGRITTKEYSADGLSTTVTTPAGATFVTTNNLDGSTASISGTGQRAQHYSYDISGKNLRTTAKLSAGNIISQTIVNGFGLTVVKTAPSSNGYIYTRSEFNANGQLVKQYRDTGWNTTSTAPTLYEYDTFGNVAKQTVALSESPDVSNSPTAETVYGVVNSEDGVYQTVSVTRYNSQGTAITESRKTLISMLSGTLLNKQIITDARGNDSVSRTEYEAPSKVKNFHITPTSEIVAESTVMDGFTIATKNHAGHVSSAIRIYTSTGMTLHSTDGRGNTSTREFDVNGRPVKHTDAANFSWTILYDEYVNSPSVIIDSLGNEAHFKYDVRGRKIAEWGTKVRPVKFGYDDANNLTTLTTFRVSSAQISDDPSERTDGDTTSWSYDPATGLELSKTFADNSVINKSYDAYNRLLTITDARGRVKTNSYEHARGLLMGITYSDNTAAKAFAYNHMGQLTQVSDASGIIAYEYNDFGEKVGDILTADGVVHHIAENRDDFGRSTGYTYTKNDVIQQTVNTGYGSDGRIDSAGFIHNGTEKAFDFNYLTGSNLLQSIVMPNNMTLTQTYEPTRNLLVGMQYKRSSTIVVEREYEYDALGAPLQRHTSRQGSIVNDVFSYNSRAELVEAQVNGTDFEYSYDNNLNRTAVTETGVTNLYTSNELNCLTAITSEDETVQINATYDENANPTSVNTRTGAWNVEYDAENRPVLFSNEESNTVIECLYDSFGRRTVKKITVNDTVTAHQRFIYRGYQQIACLDLTRTAHPCIWLITWDPTQPVATRPLAIQKDGNWYAYGWDLTKNVCEVFGAAGYIRTTYSYKPYGEVISSGDVEQPIQWSSEYTDSELALVYYNYRHYNPATGTWLGRDNVESRNLQAYVGNNPIHYFDRLGMDFSIDPYFPPTKTDLSQPIDVDAWPLTLPGKSPSSPVFGKRDNTKYTVTASADLDGCLKIVHAFVQKEGYTILDWGTDPITLSVPVTITQNYDADSSDWSYDAQITYKLAAFGDSVVTQLASSLMQKDVTSLGCSYKYDVNTDGDKLPFINVGASVNFGDNPTYGLLTWRINIAVL